MSEYEGKHEVPSGYRLVKPHEALKSNDICCCTGRWVETERAGSMLHAHHTYYRREDKAAIDEEINPITEFTKHDQGKPRPDLIPASFLLEMGKVMAHGAEKYGVDNWQKCEDPTRYEAAAMRHLLAHLSGEEIDPDSGFSHLAHCACSMGMLFGLETKSQRVPSPTPDDDPSPPSVGARERQS